MSYEHGGAGHLSVPQVMETVPYRMSAKVVAVVELILTIFAFVIILIITVAMSSGSFDPSALPDMAETSSDKETMDLIKNYLVVFFIIVLVVLVVEMGFAYCLIVASSLSSHRPIGSRLTLVYVYLGWSFVALVLTFFRFFGSHGTIGRTVQVAIAFALRLLFTIIAWKFMTALKEARGNGSHVVVCHPVPAAPYAVQYSKPETTK